MGSHVRTLTCGNPTLHSNMAVKICVYLYNRLYSPNFHFTLGCMKSNTIQFILEKNIFHVVYIYLDYNLLETILTNIYSILFTIDLGDNSL